MHPMVPVIGLGRADPRPESFGLLICLSLPIPQHRPAALTTFPRGHAANAANLYLSPSPSVFLLRGIAPPLLGVRP